MLQYYKKLIELIVVKIDGGRKCICNNLIIKKEKTRFGTWGENCEKNERERERVREKEREREGPSTRLQTAQRELMIGAQKIGKDAANWSTPSKIFFELFPMKPPPYRLNVIYI